MDKITLEKISAKQDELNAIAKWRNDSLATLRTSDLTAEGKAQENWINNLSGSDKYYFVCNYDTLQEKDIVIGYCGLDKIHPANRTAEISMLIGTEHQGKGYGKKAVDKLLDLAFNLFNLNIVFGEVYQTTDNLKFWLKCGFKEESTLRDRKYWNGKYYDSTIFSMSKGEWFNDIRK